MSDQNLFDEFEDKVGKAMAAPDAKSEFVKRLRNEIINRPLQVKQRFVLKPVWVVAFSILLIALIVGIPSTVNALRKLFGYVPEVGLVENSSGLRMLEEPISVTRDNITLTITHVFVYQDYIELQYEIDGINPSYSNQAGMCGFKRTGFWSDADADLRLPDGTLLRRDYAGKYQFENRYAMKPVYAMSLPEDTDELTMVLKCLPFTKLGNVPENWEVSFNLVNVPAGTVVGVPVIEVEQPTQIDSGAAEEANSIYPEVTIRLEKIAPTETATIFYISMDMVNKDSSLISIIPVNVYVIDSLGQKIPLIGNFVLQPFEYRTGSLFEYVSSSIPADGPLTLVVENAVAYYAPLYTDAPQVTPEELSFSFDTGENPQHKQSWNINDEFEIGGFPVKVISARAITFNDDVQSLEWNDPDSQGFDYGYQFMIETDQAIKMNLEMDITTEAYNFACAPMNVSSFVPESSLNQYSILCKDEFPKGILTVTLRQISIAIPNKWQVTWQP